ncbi:lipase member H-like [Pogonomyrmex barbatus]|uniref:phospholipase A1 n=1 Tax=Pogonomyrmex barbatus TaxID=144034 RepID=A0A6I9W015_9HYME|nr:lipase member H-like [Pogonomyrmex barbatus]
MNICKKRILNLGILYSFKMLKTIIYSYVLLFIVIKTVDCSCSCDEADSDFMIGVNLLYYKCNDENETIAYPIATPEDMLNVLENKRTIFYIFGYLESPEKSNVQIMMKALCHERMDNVVLLDWSKYSTGNYLSVFEDAKKVGSSFAESIQKLVNSGFNVSNIYIVAHSLGTAIAGFAGKCNDFMIPRITALDPANPIFNPLESCYLTKDDASWVDVIHTDMGGYGTYYPMGTADFYANSGHRPQPGCPLIGIPLDTDLCSHQRSVEIYAESKVSDTLFMAVKCSCYYSCSLHTCDENDQLAVGYRSSNRMGTFYFEIGSNETDDYIS